jgi:threonine aldolase
MATLPSKSEIMDACPHRLVGHGVIPIQKQLLELVDHVDPHLAADRYGQGEVIRRFEDKIAACLGKEAALFFPSGTMAQQIALRIWSDRSGRKAVGMNPTCHIFRDEQDGYAHLHHLEAKLVGEWDRQIRPSDLGADTKGLGSLVIELPQRNNGGTLPTWEELVEIKAWCKANDVVFHLDGARLWEAMPYYAKTEAELTALFDSVYVSFYKGLGGIGGAMLAGPAWLIDEARIWQRRHGGNLIHLYPYVVAADRGFEKYRPRMATYVARAQEISRFVGKLAHVRVTPEVPPANMMHLSFTKPQAEVEQAALETSNETGLWLFGGLWVRPFAPAPVTEISVGEAAMAAGMPLIERALRRLDERLA